MENVSKVSKLATKCDNINSNKKLLQRVTGITECGSCYKMKCEM